MSDPFEVVRVPGTRALEELNALAAQGRGYPVLVGTQEDLDLLLENYEFGKDSTEDLLLAADRLDALEWLGERAGTDPEYYEEIHGAWPEESEPSNQFTGHADIRTGKPYEEVCIVLVPAEHSWQAPCLLKYGGWNECPFAPEHAALFKFWEEQYGAKVVTISGDTIEMSVERPPTTKEAALALARQQYIYCADIVQQGTDTIEALAATLLDGHVWFFWWD